MRRPHRDYLEKLITVTNHPTEPSADLREAASALWQMYVALTNEGFNEQQALVIIGQVLLGQQGGLAP